MFSLLGRVVAGLKRASCGDTAFRDLATPSGWDLEGDDSQGGDASPGVKSLDIAHGAKLLTDEDESAYMMSDPCVSTLTGSSPPLHFNQNFGHTHRSRAQHDS